MKPDPTTGRIVDTIRAAIQRATEDWDKDLLSRLLQEVNVAIAPGAPEAYSHTTLVTSLLTLVVAGSS
jgi:cytochrome P450